MIGGINLPKSRSPQPLHSAVRRSPSDLLERCGKIFLEIVKILHAYGQPYQVVVDPEGCALLDWNGTVRHERGMFNKAFYPAEALREGKKLRLFQKSPSARKI